MSPDEEKRRQILERELYGDPVAWLESVYDHYAEIRDGLKKGEPGFDNFHQGLIFLRKSIESLAKYLDELADNEA